MQHKMRRIVETLACERRYGIADAKGAEYSGAGSTYKEDGADTLRNFKSVAERIGGTPEQVLMTYLLKHIDSINTAVREASGREQTLDVPDATLVYAAGEGIVSRLDDARNYLDLLECLLIDRGLIEPLRDQRGLANSNPGIPVVSGFDGDEITEIEGWRYVERRVYVSGEEDPGQFMSEEEVLEQAGLVECLDGVWRPAATKDESVKNPGETQVPIYAQDPVAESARVAEFEHRHSDPFEVHPTMDEVRYGETGELI